MARQLRPKKESITPMSELIISAARKTFITPEKVALNAVDNVSFTINSGEFFVMLGPSGCGKTTLLRAIAGLEVLDEGTITLGSQRIDNLAPHLRPVNTVFQSYALFPHLTVWQNVAFGLQMERKSKNEVATIVDEMLALVRLSELANRKPSEISGGQQQRVALARALAKKPQVLLLDEPLAALDLKLRRGMQTELKNLQQQTGVTFVFVTHDQEEALSMGDRIAVFNQGRPEQIGTPEEIYEKPVSRFVADFIGETNFLQDNDGRTLAIRPERIIINGKEPEFAEGTLTSLVYMGTDLRCSVTLPDGGEVAVRVPPPFDSDNLRVGAAVKLCASPEHLRTLNEETPR